MLSYCCRKNKESKNLKVVKTINGEIMLLSKCQVSDSKNLKFIKEQEASKLLSSLGIKTPLTFLFCFNSIKQVNTRYKMNEIVKMLLLAGDKLMAEKHLRQPGFAYSACGTLTKNKERTQKIKETGGS